MSATESSTRSTVHLHPVLNPIPNPNPDPNPNPNPNPDPDPNPYPNPARFTGLGRVSSANGSTNNHPVYADGTPLGVLIEFDNGETHTATSNF